MIDYECAYRAMRSELLAKMSPIVREHFNFKLDTSMASEPDMLTEYVKTLTDPNMQFGNLHELGIMFNELYQSLIDSELPEWVAGQITIEQYKYLAATSERPDGT